MSDGAASSEVSRKAKKAAQEMVKRFTKIMVHGRKMLAVTATGAVRECVCRLDRNLEVLTMEVEGRERALPLETVKAVHSAGVDLEAARRLSSNSHLDDMCAIVLLDADQCLSFRFKDPEVRDDFVQCMRLFTGSRRASTYGFTGALMAQVQDAFFEGGRGEAAQSNERYAVL
mmetsp:Transcript_108563/g.248805  ORF Transcript_108563/g.248805 Transcript_108563/m.248805 type:complete len:173 (-) Transcript_108563:16-534(-)